MHIFQCRTNFDFRNDSSAVVANLHSLSAVAKSYSVRPAWVKKRG